jgi:hypothetical protein
LTPVACIAAFECKHTLLLLPLLLLLLLLPLLLLLLLLAGALGALCEGEEVTELRSRRMRTCNSDARQHVRG